jgi:hypothetical protein
MPFRDSTGQPWPLTVDLPAARRVRDLVGVNLLTLRVDRLCAELADPIRLCEVLYAICKPEADAAGLDLDGFLRRLAVDLPAISAEFLGGLPDFFQRHGDPIRAVQLRMALEKTRNLPTMNPETLEALLSETMDWMLARIQVLTNQTPSNPSGIYATNWPESSG